MAFIVLCGKANTAPDRIVGPFDTEDEAQSWATAQPDQPARYAGVMPVSAPS